MRIIIRANFLWGPGMHWLYILSPSPAFSVATWRTHAARCRLFICDEDARHVTAISARGSYIELYGDIFSLRAAVMYIYIYIYTYAESDGIYQVTVYRNR